MTSEQLIVWHIDTPIYCGDETRPWERCLPFQSPNKINLRKPVDKQRLILAIVIAVATPKSGSSSERLTKHIMCKYRLYSFCRSSSRRTWFAPLWPVKSFRLYRAFFYYMPASIFSSFIRFWKRILFLTFSFLCPFFNKYEHFVVEHQPGTQHGKEQPALH